MHIINNTVYTTRFHDKNKNATTREGNIEGRPPIKHRRKNKTQKSENNTNTTVPQTTKQTSILDYQKDKQTTRFNYS